MSEATPVKEWVPDDNAASCMVCTKAFSYKRRKHHCRLCGRVICGSCSRNRVKIQHVTKKDKVRVCDRCFSSMAPSYMQRSPLDECDDGYDTPPPSRGGGFGSRSFSTKESLGMRGLLPPNNYGTYSGRENQQALQEDDEGCCSCCRCC